jgi:hypothetical protein
MLKFFKKKINYFIIKLTIVSVTLLTTMVTFLAIPKTIFSSNAHYEMTTPMAILDQSNLLLYKYKVYSDETRFNTGLMIDLEAERLQFASRNELMVVKIPGEFKIEFQSDYILMVEPEIPELNIEYYLVKNIQIDETSIPARTAILLLRNVFQTINTIYLTTILIVFFLLFVPQTIQTFKILFSINHLRTSKSIKVDLKKKKLGK